MEVNIEKVNTMIMMNYSSNFIKLPMAF